MKMMYVKIKQITHLVKVLSEGNVLGNGHRNLLCKLIFESSIMYVYFSIATKVILDPSLQQVMIYLRGSGNNVGDFGLEICRYVGSNPGDDHPEQGFPKFPSVSQVNAEM